MIRRVEGTSFWGREWVGDQGVEAVKNRAVTGAVFGRGKFGYVGACGDDAID